MRTISRRELLRTGATAAVAGIGLSMAGRMLNQPASAYVPDNPPGPRPAQDVSVKVLHPLDRVPMSFIIDDSTCLVNMGAFCMPQFAGAWPQRPEYKRPWKEWPREIPDDFVREFGDFCGSLGIKGKYSIVPYPACVGWLDRELPGWSKKDLQDSLKLVREFMVPNWDITPEMITHTRVIDLKTGRPMQEMTAATMENSYPQEKKSVDELAAYIAYALRILKNCDIPCTGITTPGGFGNLEKPELALAVRQAVGDVFAPEIPFYFKYIADGKDESTRPRIEQVEGLGTDNLKFVVNVPGGIGDHFSGWDGFLEPQPDKYATEDMTGGRIVELIEKNEPAVLFCHWDSLFSNGKKSGFNAFKRVANGLHQKYRDRMHWMKNSEMARYFAARELTKIERQGNAITLTAPIATPNFTLRIDKPTSPKPQITSDGKDVALEEVNDPKAVKSGTWRRVGESALACFDLAKGITTIKV